MKTFDTSAGPPDFDRLTGMNSHTLVAGVVAELHEHFGTEPPVELESELLRRLCVFFALHGGWRARILRAPTPDFVRIFLRRWASELLFHRCRNLYESLPASYRTGSPIHPLNSLGLKGRMEFAAEVNKPSEATPLLV